MRQHAEGLWTHAAPLSLLGAELGTRMTVLETPEGLILCSPTPIDDAPAAEIDARGEVRWIVAPNLFHHLYVEGAKARWPTAEVLTVPGLADKEEQLPSDRVIDGEVPSAWDDTTDAHLIEGMPKLNELALLHRPSRTLVVADFLFNLTEGGWWTRTLFRMAGAYGAPKQSKLLRSMVKDRDAVRRSRDTLLDCDFDRLVMCHGRVLEEGGKDALRDAAAWLG